MRLLKRSDLSEHPQVRLVGKDQNEIVTADVALNMARDQNLDLVCVSDQNEPWVVRIEDFRKIQFERKKAKKSQKAKTRQSTLKEVQFKLRIAEHDLEVKLDKVRKFLERGDKVKATVRLRGRERANPERARELIAEVARRVHGKVATSGATPTVAIIEPMDQKSAN